MKYEKLILSSNTSQNYCIKENNIIDSNFINEETYDIRVSSISTTYTVTYENISLLETHSYSNEQEELLFMSFVNQRKMHRYTKALIDCENEDISEEEFEEIEDSCVLSINKDSESLISEKLLYFHDLMKKYAPEEIKYINNEDLADLLAISEHKINKLHYKIAYE